MAHRKAKRQKTNSYIMGVIPTAERHRHHGGLRYGFVKAGGGALTPRYRARWATPLDLYRKREIISRDAYQAGPQFGQAYHHAVSGIPACRERARHFATPEESADTSDNPILKALAFVKQAYASLSSDTVNVMIDVCAYEQPVERPDELTLLCRGLARLARQWETATTELCAHRKF